MSSVRVQYVQCTFTVCPVYMYSKIFGKNECRANDCRPVEAGDISCPEEGDGDGEEVYECNSNITGLRGCQGLMVDLKIVTAVENWRVGV